MRLIKSTFDRRYTHADGETQASMHGLGVSSGLKSISRSSEAPGQTPANVIYTVCGNGVAQKLVCILACLSVYSSSTVCLYYVAQPTSRCLLIGKTP